MNAHELFFYSIGRYICLDLNVKYMCITKMNERVRERERGQTWD